MSKQQLAHVADQNRNLVVGGNVNIPRTIKIDYGKVKISQTPIIDGKQIRSTVVFHAMKTDECAIHYIENKLGKNIVVMNFASRHNHGGGYRRGAKAQEEDLCRVMPGLYPSLCKIQYPYDEDTVLITSHVSIMRNNANYNFFPRGTTYDVSVASVAAPNLRHEKYDEARIVRTLANMYCAVKQYLPDTDTFILGAWGCGAYGNDPTTMSRVMNEINLKYGGAFKTIVFAVPEGVNTKEFRDNITVMIKNTPSDPHYGDSDDDDYNGYD